jgi:integrase
MRKTLTDRAIAALKPHAKAYGEGDPDLAGHYLRVWPSGKKTFCAVARNPAGKQVWTTIGESDVLTIAQSRERAREIIRRVRDGLPVLEPAKASFASVAAEWIKRHVEDRGLRTGGEYQRILDRYILPEWADKEFAAIRRSDIAALLDRVADRHGPRQSDYALATIRAICNWFERRNDDYRSQVAKGMRRVNAKEAERERTLTDDEIRAVWSAASGPFGGIVKLSLLTARRRDKVVEMKWSDIVDGAWVIETEDREKGNADELVLPDLALALIEAQPRFAGSPYVFAGRGERPFSGFSKAKAALDKRCGVADWTLHDLRRTARTLLSRVGVSENHAERVLGHAIGGVKGVYDRWRYREERRIALAKLAALIDGIVNPRDNVVPLREGGR